MSKENIRHIPVVEGGEPIGIVTARDLDHYHLVYKDVDFNKEVTLGQLCLSAPYTVDENTALVKVLPFMREHKYGSVLITSNNALTGIITLIDICKTLEQVLCREI
jgi:acetoin utilization protein AcuB